MANNTQVATQQPKKTVSDIMAMPAMVSKLNAVWGNPNIAASFSSSLISIVNGNPKLRECDAMSVVGSAMVAATLQLQVVPTLGQCYIIPYGNKAQIQVGYLGLLQLCQRSGQFKRILAVPVHDGELVSGDEFNEDWVFDKSKKKSDTVIGYYAKFELINGFVKCAYWTKEQVDNHAKKYSQAVQKGWTSPWKTNYDEMGCKTVLKSILKYAPKSIEMVNALRFDQAAVNVHTENADELNIDYFTPEYVDNEPAIQDATAEEVNPGDDLFNKSEKKGK